MSINTLVQKAVDEINNNTAKATEGNVRELVNYIITTETQIAKLQAGVADAKKKLKELEMPAPVSVVL